jgi:hypothetical protein
VANFPHFVKNILKIEHLFQIPFLKKKYFSKKEFKKKFTTKSPQFAYNVKVCLRAFTFIF